MQAFSRDDQTVLATGKLETVDNEIDVTTGTAKMKAVFDNADGALWPNQFVNIHMQLSTPKMRWWFPWRRSSAGRMATLRIWLVRTGRSIQPVVIALTQGNSALISSGLQDGDQVVTEGQDKLQAGSLVTTKAPRLAQGGVPANAAAAAKGTGTNPALDDPAGGSWCGAKGWRQSMTLSRPFILRPVATSLLMVGLLLAGLVAYDQLPVSALPQVDYPTIQIAHVLSRRESGRDGSAVTAPLERQFGQLPGLTQMTSSSSFGSSVITLQFILDANIDVAEQEVQAAINAAGTYLPADLPNPPIYSKVNPADPPILTLALTSDSMPLSQG